MGKNITIENNDKITDTLIFPLPLIKLLNGDSIILIHEYNAIENETKKGIINFSFSHIL